MSGVKDRFEEPPYAHQLFAQTLRDTYDGSKRSIMDSITYTADEVRFYLEEIDEEDKFNGSTIKEGKRAESYEQVLGHVFKATEDLLQARHKSYEYQGGYVVQDREGNTQELDLNGMEEILVGAVNKWILAISADEHEEMADPALPLAINHEARENPELGITRIHDIMAQTNNGWKPKGFLSNSAAKDILERSENSKAEVAEHLAAT